jgi:hypothetical protein
MMESTPRSKLAILFYILGALSLLMNILGVLPMIQLGKSMGFGSIAGTLGFAMLVQPILISAFGGVVQMLSDIRWALVREQESN